MSKIHSVARTPSKIAVAGDWHGNLQWIKNAIDQVPDGIEFMIHVGDFGLMGANLPQYINKVTRFADAKGFDIWIVPGNHENYDWLARQPMDELGRSVISERLLALPRGFRFTIGELLTACAVGGAVSIDRGRRTPGKTWWPQEELTPDEVGEISAHGHADVLFTHDVPLGTDVPKMHQSELIESFGQFDADRAYAHHRLVRELDDALTPRRHLHGHMHARYTDHVEFRLADGSSYECIVDGLACDDMEGNLVILDVGNYGSDSGEITVTDIEVPLRRRPRW